ncbi:MAG: PfkB family carbohydrate kinase, partial [Treponema sp.]|nr:PfkB family carbohydrate kinase [Treponema sp.]
MGALPPIELLCIGNAMVDVFAPVYPLRLDEWGITEPIQHISRDQAQYVLERLTSKLIYSSGGGAANVAKIAAMLDMRAAFTGCVGEGATRSGNNLAAVFEKDLRAAGVVPFLTSGVEKTGLCFVFNCDGGETRIAASPGAALEFTEDDVREELFDGVEAVVLDGYILDRRPLVQRILQIANR